MDNLKPQCVHCNKYNHGAAGEYTARLIEENGLEWYRKLERKAGRAKKGVKHTLKYYQKIIKKYKDVRN